MADLVIVGDVQNRRGKTLDLINILPKLPQSLTIPPPPKELHNSNVKSN